MVETERLVKGMTGCISIDGSESLISWERQSVFILGGE
jgi:hypothetical protein